MANKDRIFFQQGVNMYVPAMMGNADLAMGQPAPFSLGKPAASSDALAFAAAAINLQAVANTKVTQTLNWVSDSPYGRNLILTPSGNPGNSNVVDIFGFDYLGQPLVERFTGASGSTAILYGKKAFYRVAYSNIVTAATNAVTAKVGTGTRLGLPYKGDVSWAKENGVFVNVFKRDTILERHRAGLAAASLAIAGGSVWVRPTFPGFVASVFGQPDSGGGGANPVITVKIATVAIVGLTCTITDNDTTGLLASGVPTTAGYNANNRFVTNTNIEIVGTAAAAATGDRVGIVATPTQYSAPDTTDPGTPTTADPRGTYEALVTYDGVKEIIVGLTGDNSVNASGNGGLLGIKHVVA